MNKTYKAILKKLQIFKLFLLKLFIITFQLSLFFIIIYRIFPVYITPLPIIRMIEQANSNEKIILKKEWKSIEEIGNNFCKAAIVSEDLNFLNHYGFDVEQIWHSFKNWFKKGKRLRGASTITQQTAKNLFFSTGRSWIRKVLEAYVTVAIELLWTKKRILEVYLNIIEMGNGIYGAEAASNFYYAKSASNLTKSETALIVACLPNPRKYNPLSPIRKIKRKQQLILNYIDVAVQLPW